MEQLLQRNLIPEHIFVQNLPSQPRQTDKDGIWIGYKGMGSARIPDEVIKKLLYDNRFKFKASLSQTILENLPYVLRLCIEESQIVEFILINE
jgi:hypothetical protein